MTNFLHRLAGIPTQEEYEVNKIKVQEESMKDFERVIHILSSCVHEGHISTADNCFDVFKNKWRELSKEVMDYNYLIYCKERKKLLDKFARLDCLLEERSGELLLT